MDNASRLENRMIRDIVVAALVVVALAGGWLLLARAQAHTQAEAVRMVETAGLQRALSQRIAMLSLALSAAPDEAGFAELASDLARAVSGFRQTHAALAAEAENQPAMLGALYRGAPGLTERVGTWLDAVDRVMAAGTPGSVPEPALTEVMTAARGALILALDEAVAAQRLAAEAEAGQLRLARAGLFATTLAAVAGLGLLVFAPLVQHVRRDAEALIAARDAMAHGALHDPLTGLPNRRYLTDFLDRTLAQARRNGHTVGVLQIDLDRFKAINDTMGHAAGDAVLVAAARIMTHTVRKSDFVARTGGDEFVIVSPECNKPRGLAILAGRLIERIAHPIPWEGEPCRIGASIGIALAFPDQPVDADRLMMNADIALYEAKNAGRDCFRYYRSLEEVVAEPPVLAAVAGETRV